MLETIVTIVHVLTCFFLILVILLQSGKGGGISAAFGGGAGAALGQRSASTVLTKLTGYAAGIFMVTSMVLAVYATPSAGSGIRDAAKKEAAAAAAASVASEAGIKADAPASEPAKTDAPAEGENQ